MDADGCVHVLFRNGQSGNFMAADPDAWPVRSVVVVNAAEDHVRLVPAALWPEEPTVAVVRLRLEDATVVDVSGAHRLLPPGGADCAVGNTVEVRGDEIVRVLAEEPLKYLGLNDDPQTPAESFLVTHETLTETFDDFGGLPQVVARARELIEMPLRHRDLLSRIGARPIKGVLFTGLPGTGKTMLARIIAGATAASFYEVSGPRVFSKWYGESERILRGIFEHAAANAPAIIFFDEIDSVAGQRSGDAHEASKRVVATLLTLMDGFNSDTNVVVIAATNRPGDIDDALRRPGRFDWELDFPLPQAADRAEILAKAARHLRTSNDLPHERVAGMTDGWSAAELAAIYSEASLLAARDERDRIMTEDYLGGMERVRDRRSRNRPEAG